jgi:hypothetical protein
MSEKKQYMRPTPQNRGLGALAKGLRRAREGLNYVPLPEVLGGGAGNLLLGESPEEVEAWSYGSSPFKENPSASIIPIEVRPGREQRLLDTAFLPAAEAYGLAKLAGAGVRRGVQGALAGATQKGRREFLKKAGQAAAGTAAVASAPDLVRNVGKEVAPTAAKTAVRAASPKEFMDLLRGNYWGAGNRAIEVVDKMGWEDMVNMFSKMPGSYHGKHDLDSLRFEDGAPGGFMHEEIKNYLHDQYVIEGVDKLLTDPRFAPYSEYANHVKLDALNQNYISHDAMKDLDKAYKTTQKASGGMIENTTHDRKLI